MWVWLVIIGVLALVVRYLSAPESPPRKDEAEDHVTPELDDDSEPFVVPIGDALDLHTFAPAEITDVVRSYLEAARKEGYREVRLIHGKGMGVQRARVRSLLASHSDVLEFKDAPVTRGGWGATIVVLRTDQVIIG